ncbi:hypothetical protein, partial [Rhizobium sp. P007]|uniref:hypothetical protein n=1 Tax=Rhizobium sp. P007 TaxID=285908 RepID=UPI001AEE80A6
PFACGISASTKLNCLLSRTDIVTSPAILDRVNHNHGILQRVPAGRSPRQRDEGGKLSENLRRYPLIRPFGPPSPPKGEETSGILSAKITPDKRKACLFAGLAAISQSHRQF